MKRILEMKGTSSGLHLKIDPDVDFEEILSLLDRQLVENNEFYCNHRFVGTKGRSLTYAEKARIDEVLFRRTGQYAESLETIESSRRKLSNKDEEAIRAQVYREYQKLLDEEIGPRLKKLEQDLAAEQKKNVELTRLAEEAAGSAKQKAEDADSSDMVRIHHGTLRSGSRLQYDGHIVVIGDINAGAEVVASGNIICIGRALGLVHAGANGDESSFVLALHLAPIQVRISKYVSGPPSGKKYKPSDFPEIAKLEDGLIRIVGV